MAEKKAVKVANPKLPADEEPSAGEAMTKKDAVVSAQPRKLPVLKQILTALEVLKERKGTTLVAIKKYVYDNYHQDGDKQKVGHKVLKVLKQAVVDGHLVQPEGQLRFKISPEEQKQKKTAEKEKEKAKKNAEKMKEKAKKKKKTATQEPKSAEKGDDDEPPKAKKPKISKTKKNEEVGEASSKEESTKKKAKATASKPKIGAARKSLSKAQEMKIRKSTVVKLPKARKPK